jgi:hypothetical protein
MRQASRQKTIENPAPPKWQPACDIRGDEKQGQAEPASVSGQDHDTAMLHPPNPCHQAQPPPQYHDTTAEGHQAGTPNKQRHCCRFAATSFGGARRMASLSCQLAHPCIHLWQASVCLLIKTVVTMHAVPLRHEPRAHINPLL